MEISIGSDPWVFLYTVNIGLRKKVITRELLGFKRSLLYEKLSRNQELLEFAIYFIIRRHRDDETTRRPFCRHTVYRLQTQNVHQLNVVRKIYYTNIS